MKDDSLGEPVTGERCRNREDGRGNRLTFGTGSGADDGLRAKVLPALADHIALGQPSVFQKETEAFHLGLTGVAVLVFDLEGNDAVSDFDNQVHFQVLVGFVTPVGKGGLLGVVAGEDVFEEGGFDSGAQAIGLLQQAAAQEENGTRQGGVGKVDFPFPAQDLFSITKLTQAVNEVGAFKEVEEMADRLAIEAIELLREIGNIEDATVVITEVKEDLLQFEDAAHPIEGRHVPFEDLVHNVLTQQPLASG